VTAPGEGERDALLDMATELKCYRSGRGRDEEEEESRRQQKLERDASGEVEFLHLTTRLHLVSLTVVRLSEPADCS